MPRASTKQAKPAPPAEPTPQEPAAEAEAPTEAAPPALFEHGLCRRDVYAIVRELRNELANAARPEVAHADALLAILPPV